MNSIDKTINILTLVVIFFFVLAIPEKTTAQEKSPTKNRAQIIQAARTIIDSTRYCALITVDSTGQAHARAMDPFPPDEDMVIWLGTNPKSRKVNEIRYNPKVTLYYMDPSGAGYVTIIGTASLVDDPSEKSRRWKEEWDEFYKNQGENYLLIQVVPNKLEVVSYKHDLTGDSVTWKAPEIEFEVK